MFPAGKLPQHGGGLIGIRRLAENPAVDYDTGVGAEHHRVPTLAVRQAQPAGMRLLAGQTLDIGLRLFTREGGFINIRWRQTRKHHAYLRQQFRATRRGRGQQQASHQRTRKRRRVQRKACITGRHRTALLTAPASMTSGDTWARPAISCTWKLISEATPASMNTTALCCSGGNTRMRLYTDCAIYTTTTIASACWPSTVPASTSWNNPT